MDARNEEMEEDLSRSSSDFANKGWVELWELRLPRTPFLGCPSFSHHI
jgi:hypothetical protein